ncbi:anti-adapter protein IraP [Buttiauxella selenatireducens]|uniref:Anti-adapter protein IraP n=1 Tax=Buttiauxella selenatireducens TaxID=3073902 RepID=A0ABY9S7S3_9ENTR|nr:anti-adapter protein IraP [Buttiauxella sp. R73]WMY73563.1 anti-adapter protein IraP [Buttiauxella sp. R73]
MRNLISELLTRLAEKEEESKEFVAQIEALEIVVTAILHKMECSQLQAITTSIEDALSNVRPSDTITSHDAHLLKKNLTRILNRPCV